MNADDGRPTILGLPADPDQLKVGIVQSTPTNPPPKPRPAAITPNQAVAVLLVIIGMVCATTLGIVWMITHG